MKKIFLPLLLFYAGWLAAQDAPPRRFHWGGWLGYDDTHLVPHTYDENMPHRRNWPGPMAMKGANLGAFGRWRLARGIALQPEVALAWSARRFTFQRQGEGQQEAVYTFTDVELPLHLVFTNPLGRLPLHGSFLLGGRLSWNFAQNKMDLPFQLLHERLGLDAGLGIELRLPRGWRLQPELVYSHGINNLLDVESPALLGRVERDRLTLRILGWRERL